MKVDKQEVAMVMAIVWIFSVVAQIQQIGFWPSLLAGLPLGLLAGAAYWLLMPWVIRWASNKKPPPDQGEEKSPETNGESDARP